MDGLYQWDESAFRAIHGLRSAWLDPLGRMINDSGLGHVQLLALILCGYRRKMKGVWVAICAVLLAALVVFVEKDAVAPMSVALTILLFWRLPAPVCFGALASGAITGIIRAPFAKWVARPRPSNLDYSKPLEEVYGATSFPSGHSSTTLAVALFIVYALWDTEDRALCYPIIAWALLAAGSRMYAGVHYPTDIMGGLCMAGIFGTAVWLWLGPKVKRAMSPAAPPEPKEESLHP